MLSPSKQGIFRPLVAKAWTAHCARTGIPVSDKNAHEKWYRKNLLDGAHIYTTNEIRDEEQFDQIMLHFATISGDAKEIAYWCQADERRARYLISQRLRQISALTGSPHNWSYACAICKHMSLPLTMEEAPLEHLQKVFIALDTHLQRLRKRGSSAVSAQPAAVSVPPF